MTKFLKSVLASLMMVYSPADFLNMDVGKVECVRLRGNLLKGKHHPAQAQSGAPHGPAAAAIASMVHQVVHASTGNTRLRFVEELAHTQKRVSTPRSTQKSLSTTFRSIGGRETSRSGERRHMKKLLANEDTTVSGVPFEWLRYKYTTSEKGNPSGFEQALRQLLELKKPEFPGRDFENFQSLCNNWQVGLTEVWDRFQSIDNFIEFIGGYLNVVANSQKGDEDFLFFFKGMGDDQGLDGRRSYAVELLSWALKSIFNNNNYVHIKKK